MSSSEIKSVVIIIAMEGTLVRTPVACASTAALPSFSQATYVSEG